MKHRGRLALTVAGITALLLLACRISPALDRAACDGFSRPVTAWLHRLTAPIPFPVAEIIALSAVTILMCTLLASVRSAAALRRRLRGTLRTALMVGSALALLWGPPLLLPEEAVLMPSDGQLIWLCEGLIGELNASSLSFPDPGACLRLAPSVAGSAEIVKAARYPEWMRAAGICGLFVPLTGEALVDAGTPAPLLPFTAVHELMHLSGIAGEGAANVAAWQRCLDAGGPAADSARLWALRYAMGLLRSRDPVAWRRVGEKMEAHLSQIFRQCGGEIAPGTRGHSPGRGDYAALAAYLALAPS